MYSSSITSIIIPELVLPDSVGLFVKTLLIKITVSFCGLKKSVYKESYSCFQTSMMTGLKSALLPNLPATP